jgi:outer membrane protein assembly factor BamB
VDNVGNDRRANPHAVASDGLPYLNGGRGRSLFAIRPGATGDISLKEGEKSNKHVVWSEARGGTYLPIGDPLAE